MIQVLIAENVHLIRSGLLSLLSEIEGMQVVEAVDRCGKLAAAALRHKPDVALVDTDLPDFDAFSAVHRLRGDVPGCAVIMMAPKRRSGDLRRAVLAGASGFVLKDTSPAELVEAIRRVARGGRVIDAELAVVELSAVRSPLTPREVEVLQVVAQGATVSEIAEELYLSCGTVRNYLSRILAKLDARTRIEAVKIAQARGWLSADTTPMH